MSSSTATTSYDNEIVVRRTSDDGTEAADDLIAVSDEHRKAAKRHPAGTTDRLPQADRDPPLLTAVPSLIEATGA